MSLVLFHFLLEIERRLECTQNILKGFLKESDREIEPLG